MSELQFWELGVVMQERRSSEEVAHRIVDMMEQDGVTTQAEAARRLGVSRARVNQIVLEKGIPLRRKRRKLKKFFHCKDCGQKTKVKAWSKGFRYCPSCVRRHIHGGQVTVTCPFCGSQRKLPPSAARLLKSSVCRKGGHCLRGHLFTPENTVIRSTGRRTCRRCLYGDRDASEEQ